MTEQGCYRSLFSRQPTEKKVFILQMQALDSDDVCLSTVHENISAGKKKIVAAWDAHIFK